MNFKQLQNLQQPFPQPQRQFGHAHFWERAMLSRRQFLKAAGATTAVVFASGLMKPSLAHAAGLPGNAPKPIPGGITIPGLGLFHVFIPTDNPFGPSIESGKGDPSTITDFNGFVGVGDFAGGTGTGTSGVHKTPLFWAADIRFMTGEYIGVDGHRHHGAFAFV